jgi:hypothetical protein
MLYNIFTYSTVHSISAYILKIIRYSHAHKEIYSGIKKAYEKVVFAPLCTFPVI